MTPGFMLDLVLMSWQAMSFLPIADLLAKGVRVGVMQPSRAAEGSSYD
jgi:hypothetical protein